MRKLSALLFVLLLCSLQLVFNAPSAVNPASCCPGVSKMNLSIKHIVSYSWTHGNCSIKAVIFKMVSGKQFCMNPASDWVNAYMREVNQSEMTSSGESPELTQLQSGVTTAPQREIPDCCPTVTDEKKVESSSWTSSSFTPKVTVYETVAEKLFCVNADGVGVSGHITGV
ncbi:eotaxin-like [Brachyhypopomus gauderio]|uniref:eotaxin-like n=1 Tax=Brachyhypopomus gauderio TaxID=698409 RepID=UPI004041E918